MTFKRIRTDESHGCMTGIMLLYLPTYSPDLNPIEESFSTCAHISFFFLFTHILAGKAYLRRNGTILRAAEDPIAVLLDSCGCITAEMAEGWFRHAGYIL